MDTCLRVVDPKENQISSRLHAKQQCTHSAETRAKTRVGWGAGHLPGIMSFLAATPNSYRRLQPSSWTGAFQVSFGLVLHMFCTPVWGEYAIDCPVTLAWTHLHPRLLLFILCLEVLVIT